MSEINQIWTQATIASIGKQLGRLENQYFHESKILIEVRKIEKEFEEIVFGEASIQDLMNICEKLGKVKELSLASA